MQLKHSLLAANFLLALLSFTAVNAAIGDTFAADLSPKTLPSNGTYTPGKGAGAMTIVEQQQDLFLWELDVYQTGAFTSIQAVYNAPGTPVVYEFPFTYSSTDLVYFGNFTRQELQQGLQQHGYDESVFRSDQLYCVIGFGGANPPTTAIGGLFSATLVANFTDDAASSPGSSTTDYGESIQSSLIYIAQMDNVTISLYESGFQEGNGTGSFIMQDMYDGTYEWTLDILNNNGPRELQLRYFANLSSQPVVLNFTTEPRLNSKDETYLGNITAAQVQEGLQAIGAPQYVVDQYFNVTPPVLFVSLTDKKNGTIVGFIFDANAPATQQPIVKSAAMMLQSTAGVLIATAIASVLALLL